MDVNTEDTSVVNTLNNFAKDSIETYDFGLVSLALLVYTPREKLGSMMLR